MKTQSLTMGLAFLVAAFMWGCQEQASGPVGPYGPQFDKPVKTKDQCTALGFVLDEKGHCHGKDAAPPPPGAVSRDLFDSSGFTCAGGASSRTDKVGQVSWAAIFVGEAALPADDHIHYDLQLTGVAAGDYTIFGSQHPGGNCSGTTGLPTGAVDIGTVKVKKNGKVVTPGALIFEFPRHDAGGLMTNVWVTVSGPAGAATTVFYRSPALEVEIPSHVEVQ